MDMIIKFPFLEHFTRPTLRRLINHFKKEEMLRNSILYRQGDEFTHIYLILFGEFSEKKTNASRSDVNSDSPRKEGALKKNFLVNKAADSGSDSEIRILKSFQTCGLEEWMAGSSTYLTTVKCISASGEVESPE